MNEADPFTGASARRCIASIEVSFKCLRAAARSTAALKRALRRCEGARMQIVSTRRETTAAAMIEGFIMRFICRAAETDRLKFVHGTKSDRESY